MNRNIQFMPDEVKLMILSNLSYDDIMNYSKTNNQSRLLVLDPYLWLLMSRQLGATDKEFNNYSQLGITPIERYLELKEKYELYSKIKNEFLLLGSKGKIFPVYVKHRMHQLKFDYPELKAIEAYKFAGNEYHSIKKDLMDYINKK